MRNLLITYRNYLYSLQARQEYGEKFGDTQELIDMYEDILIKAGIIKPEPMKNQISIEEYTKSLKKEKKKNE